MAKLFFFDLETTGLDNNTAAIHQLSGAIEIDGAVSEFFDIRMRPFAGAAISEEALNIAGITVDDLTCYPSQEEGYRTLISILSKYVDRFNKMDKFFLAGFNNAAFDNQFLRKFFERNNDKYFGSWFYPNSLDCYVLATQKLLNTRHKMVNFKQFTVAQALGIEVDENRLHNAEYDIYLTREIYNKCTKGI